MTAVQTTPSDTGYRASRPRTTSTFTEAKMGFKTSEFYVTVVFVVGVLLAKSMAADPMTSVNALVTNGSHRPRVSPKQWRSCGGDALRRLRTTERLRLVRR